MNRRGLLMIVAIVPALIAAYGVNPLVRFHVHFLITQVCHGVSAGKVFFTLAFVGVFCLRTVFLRGDRNLRRPSSISLGVCLAIGMVAAMVSHLLYIARYHLPLNWHAFHWKDGLNSVTCATHIHTSKVCIAHVLGMLGLERLYNRFDTGAVYMDAVPSWLAVVIAASFLVALYFALRTGPLVVARYPHREQPAVALVLSLVLASLCKCVLDGGPLAYDAVAAAVFMFAMFRSESIAAIGHTLWRHGRRVGILLALWLTVVAAIDVTFVSHQAAQFAYRATIYGAILGIAYLFTQRRRASRIAWGVSAVACAACVCFAVAQAERYLLPLWRSAPHCVIKYDWLDGPQVVDAQMHFAECERCAVAPGASYLSAYSTLGETPNRVRRVSVGNHESGTATGLYTDLIILSTRADHLAMTPSDILTIERLDVVDENGAARFRLDVQFDAGLGPALWRGDDEGRTQIDENERFVAYTLLDHYLSACGVEEYILIPLAQYAELRTAASDEAHGYGPV